MGFHVLKCHNHNPLHLEDLRGTNIRDGDLGGRGHFRSYFHQEMERRILVQSWRSLKPSLSKVDNSFYLFYFPPYEMNAKWKMRAATFSFAFWKIGNSRRQTTIFHFNRFSSQSMDSKIPRATFVQVAPSGFKITVW